MYQKVIYGDENKHYLALNLSDWSSKCDKITISIPDGSYQKTVEYTNYATDHQYVLMYEHLGESKSIVIKGYDSSPKEVFSQIVYLDELQPQ